MFTMAVANPRRESAVPSRNPLPLSASQEAQVRDVFYARVRKQCDEEIRGTALPSHVLSGSVFSTV
jgi:COX assembly mitochondrial protein 1